jgi:CRISPR-associated protein Csm4
MTAFPTYYLSFRSPLHVGERGVGLEETRTHVPADTLFGAIWSVWRLLHGLGDLETELLPRYQDGAGAEPFFITSAFPYADDIRLFPKPLGTLPGVKVSEEDAKAFRRIRYVSEAVFSSLARGDSQQFDRSHCISGGAAWVTNAERDRLSWLADELTGDPSLWRKTVVPRVTLDRLSSSSAIWHFGKLILQERCGLWFAARFNSAYPEVRSKFEGALRLLGDEGLCGERGAGYGLFELQAAKEQEIPGVEGATHCATLSPVFPKSESEARLLIGSGSAYDISARRGWVTSPEASNLRRKVAWMFSEGSVLTQTDQIFAGGLADVRPDLCSHKVWRYGYSFPAGVKV